MYIASGHFIRTYTLEFVKASAMVMMTMLDDFVHDSRSMISNKLEPTAECRREDEKKRALTHEKNVV